MRPLPRCKMKKNVLNVTFGAYFTLPPFLLHIGQILLENTPFVPRLWVKFCQGQSGWLSIEGGGSPPSPLILPNRLGQNISAKRRGGTPLAEKITTETWWPWRIHITKRKDKEILPQYHPRPPPQPIRASPPPLAKPWHNRDHHFCHFH